MNGRRVDDDGEGDELVSFHVTIGHVCKLYLPLGLEQDKIRECELRVDSDMPLLLYNTYCDLYHKFARITKFTCNGRNVNIMDLSIRR